MSTATLAPEPTLSELVAAHADARERLDKLDSRAAEIDVREAEIAEALVSLDADEDKLRLQATRAGLSTASKTAIALAEFAEQRAALEHELAELHRERAATSTVRSEVATEEGLAAFAAARAQAEPLKANERELWRELGEIPGTIERLYTELVENARALEKARMSVSDYVPGVTTDMRDELQPAVVPFPVDAMSAIQRVLEAASKERLTPPDWRGELQELVPRAAAAFVCRPVPGAGDTYSGVRAYKWIP